MTDAVIKDSANKPKGSVSRRAEVRGVGTDMVLAGTALSSCGSLDAYIRAVNAIPALSAERERQLAIEYREHDDLEAARALVMSQLSYVVHVAHGYKGYGLSLADLIQEGNVGLMKAAKNFDPYRGVRFITFAAYWIRAEIYEFIVRNWRIVKIATTKAQRKLFFGLRKSRKRLGLMNSSELKAAAEHFDVDVGDVALMDARFNEGDCSFDAGPGEAGADADAEPTAPAPASFVASDAMDNPELKLVEEDTHDARRRAVGAALSALDERSADIVRSRWLRAEGEKKLTLQHLAERYGISVERVRQVERAAMDKIRTALQDVPALLA